MNQKLIATSVFKHPLVQPLIELKSLEQSLINQIIIEEVLRERSNDPLDILADFVDEKESLFNRIEDYITHAKNNPEDLKGLHQKLTFGDYLGLARGSLAVPGGARRNPEWSHRL